MASDAGNEYSFEAYSILVSFASPISFFLSLPKDFRWGGSKQA